MRPPAGTRVTVSGGYDFEPEWLAGTPHVTGHVEKWIPGQNATPACVVQLDQPLTATGLVHGRREKLTGIFLVLELRYVGQEWEPSGTVHVVLCGTEPHDKSCADREVGAWVESHATYTFGA
jgi:hypothetical protein